MPHRPLPPLIETAIRGRFLRRAAVLVLVLLAVAFALVATLSPRSGPP